MSASAAAPLSAGLALLNGFQRGFPLVPRPFEEVGRRCGLEEAAVLEAVREHASRGTISRVGVVFAPGAVGASTLAAMALPSAQLVSVARLVSAQPEVNHNYEREHRYNLWFVVTAAAAGAVDAALERIARASGHAVLSLPLLEEYHIDLGFDLADGGAPRAARRVPARGPLGERERRLLAALEPGLALVPRPYAALGRQAGLAESEVIATLEEWLARGVARRVGVVLHHRRLGYTANAMAVWDVPDAQVARLGARLAQRPEVTLCYRRARALPAWPYNLFCMIHGRERAAVQTQLARLAREEGLERCAHDVLFSRRCFKQRGARYAGETPDG
ncbi:MAG: Lrp/AsnC family transcriptional regulator [Betaproteobacteria bacterium]|nr:Lrp/AsnC family transcriptional regulator [Betaproteobacteria bacterium]